ncbi:MAG: S8 family serine peptidase [Thermoanaerobaculales bacterium]|jgi:subtilisin family serine protease|nr:S8 family serine peptidase [Thermoanaerobaculales bacterium]
MSSGGLARRSGIQGALAIVSRAATTLPAVLVLALVAGPPAASPARAGELAPEVAARAAAGEPQSVLVHFAAGVFEKSNAGPLEQRVDRIRRIVDRAVAGLADLEATGDLRVERRFRLQPAIAAEVSPAGAAGLAARPGIRLVEPDREWWPQTLEGVELIGADILHQEGLAGEGTAVAIIDTGVDYLHPTLGGGQIPNAKVVYGLDTADGDDDPMDCHGHGTAVASVAAGVSYQWSPGRRFAGGVAPAAKILAYKATPDEGCRTATTSAVVAAIEDAVLHREGDGYRLASINISLGGGRFEGPCDTDNVAYAAAVGLAADAGIMVVAAAGNNGYPDALNAPACLSRVVSVASAWDADPGWLPYHFCLDPTCQERCDDSFKWRRAVTCYSNSEPTLDLVAPSEFLRAAAAGNVTIDFGGTSGAAAYVTGAAALLAQALDHPGQTALRYLIAASGAPTMDDKNGLLRPLVDLPAALAAAGSVVVAGDPVLPILPSPEGPTRSTIMVDSGGVVGNLEVLVDIVHPAPDQIRLTLGAPDGTEVVLHDRGPGAGGIAGRYPEDLTPVESLGRFAGVGADGPWTLAVEDIGESPPSEDGASLVGWALTIEPPEPAPYRDASLVFPVVAHTPGAHGTDWRSDVRLFNPDPTTEAEVRLLLLPPAPSTGFEPRQTDLTVPHASTVALDDIVERRFGLTGVHGSLVVQDPSGTVVHGSSRTFTSGADGTYGQFVPPAGSDTETAGRGDPPLLVLPLTGADLRVNLGITEVAGAAAVVAVTLVDSESGAAIGQSSFFGIGPHSNLQLNEVLPSPESGSDPYISVTVVQGDGRVVAYGSIIDNLSGDATFVGGSSPEPTAHLLIPVVARNRGHGGTVWRSDLRFLNAGAFSVHVDAELRLHGSIGIPPLVETFQLQPGQAVAVADVVGSLFGLDDAVGSLRLVPREGPAALVATSRTANHGGAAGSFGQYVPAIAAGAGLEDRGVLLHVDRGPESRSNLGIVETAGSGVRVLVELLDHRGRPLGVATHFTLGAWEAVQINDVFGALGAPDRRNTRIEISRDAGNGAFSAYASVIDSSSGDAIFVPLRHDPAPSP